jgi:hypothetical protein
VTFLDTNVLVYSVDGKDPIKQPTARAIVAKAIDEGRGTKLHARLTGCWSGMESESDSNSSTATWDALERK